MVRHTGLALSLLAAISLLPLTVADAGDRQARHRIQKHHGWTMTSSTAHRRDRFTHRRDIGPVVIVKVARDGGKHRHRFGKHRRAWNTYSGNVDVYSLPGVGTWSYGTLPSEIVVTSGVRSAKIIDVGNLKPGEGCEMQAGVCVIKP